MTDARGDPTAGPSPSIARQPIFDHHRRLWGYALFAVGEDRSAHADPTAASDIAASAYLGLQRMLTQGQHLLVDFDEMDILDHMPYALPPQQAVVQVDEALFLRPAIPQMLQRLKADGYAIAVRGFGGDGPLAPLYGMADIIAVPVAGKGGEELSAMAGAIAGWNARMLALRVDEVPAYEMGRAAGVTLFQGAFFKQPDTVALHKMTSTVVSRLRLLQMIEQREPDIEGLGETLQADAAISFRLLTYLNSAAFGFPQKIKSIPHAMRLLGWSRMKNWLRVILINDMSQTSDAPELLQLAAQRGHFLEQVALGHDFWGFDPQSLHLLGLFSLLDTMLGVAMTEIVTYLPIDNTLKGALCRDPNNALQPLIRLAQCLEEARWPEAEPMMGQLNLNRSKVVAAFGEAVAWADRLTLAQAP